MDPVPDEGYPKNAFEDFQGLESCYGMVHGEPFTPDRSWR